MPTRRAIPTARELHEWGEPASTVAARLLDEPGPADWAVSVLWRAAEESSCAGEFDRASALLRRALRAMQDGLAREPTSYLGLPNVFDQERGVRRLRTALAELRQAIAFHLRRPVPELRDALGDGVLTVEIDGDAATFRSADSDVARKAVRSGR